MPILEEQVRARIMAHIGELPPDMRTQRNEVKALRYALLVAMAAPTVEGMVNATSLAAELAAGMSKKEVNKAKRNAKRCADRHASNSI